MDAVEAVNKEMKENVGELKNSVAQIKARLDAGQSGQAAGAAAAGEFVPRHVYVRGFADFVNGQPPPRNTKLDEKDYKDHAEKLLGMLPEAIRDKVKIADPFPRNHEIVFRVPGGRGACFDMKEALVEAAAEYQIKECPLRFSVEIDKVRKAGYRMFFNALDHVKSKLDQGFGFFR